MKQLKTLAVTGMALMILLISGCASQQPQDFSALKKTQPRSVLIIPPTSDSVEVDAPYIYLSTLSYPFAEKGYYVFPVAVIDQFLKENGLPTPAEMNQVPLDKLVEHLGPDAILYTHIEGWGQQYNIISSTTVVKAKLRLIDAQTGAILWETTAQHKESSSDGGGGLAGMLVSAIADQIAGSLVDKTPRVAAIANNIAVAPLPQGPYKPQQ